MKLSDVYPLQLVCDVVGLSASSYYYQPQPRADAALRAHITTIVGEWPTYGYRRVTAQLEREHEPVNHKRVRRLMQAMGLLRKNRVKKRRTTNSEHPFPRYPNLLLDLSIERPDQAWVADITYVKLSREFVYLAVLMDVFTRGIRGWHLMRSLDQELTRTALRRALSQHRPEIHHSDQGLQYAAGDYERHAAGTRRGDQHGRGRRAHAEWLCRAPDAHHSRRGGEPLRLPGLCRRLSADRSLPG